jgi:hypothetical protein
MPSRAIASVDLPLRLAPSKRMLPRVLTIPEMARRVVVLPAPLGPSSAATSPCSTRRLMPCSARTGP